MDTLAPVGFAMQVCRLPVHGRCIQTCFRGRAPSFRTVPTVTRAHSDPRWRACFHSQTEEKRVVPNGSRRGDGKDGKAENTQPDEPGADAKDIIFVLPSFNPILRNCPPFFTIFKS